MCPGLFVRVVQDVLTLEGLVEVIHYISLISILLPWQGGLRLGLLLPQLRGNSAGAHYNFSFKREANIVWYPNGGTGLLK